MVTVIFIMPRTQHVQIVDGSIRSVPIHLAQNGRNITLEAREVNLRISFTGGRTGQADVLMLYEPRNKLFWWTYENREGVEPGGITGRFFSESVIYVTQTNIVSFTGGAFLSVRESTACMPNMEAGQHSVLATIENKWGEIEEGKLEGYREVNIAKSLDPNFLHLRGSAAPFPQPKVREVSMTGGQWRLVLDGPNKDAAIVFLDDQYNVVNVIWPAK